MMKNEKEIINTAEMQNETRASITVYDVPLTFIPEAGSVHPENKLEFGERMADAALRYLIVGRKGLDTGHILENVIYLELVRRGYEVYVGALKNGEIDFVAKKSDGLCYFQVSESTIDESTLKRELQPLMNLDDNYPKYLLTLDEINAEADYDGIRKMNALKWLLEE